MIAETTWHPGVVWWAWLATALLLAAILRDIRSDVRRIVSARNTVLIGLFAWYLLEALQAGPEVAKHGSGAYLAALGLVILGGVCFLIGYGRGRGAWFDGLGQRFARLENWSILADTLMIGALLGSIPIVLYALADPAETLRGLIAERHGWRGTLGRPALGDFRASVLMLENFLFGVAMVALLILGHRRRTLAMVGLAVAVVGWYLVRSYGTGSRSLVFQALLLPAAWVYWRAGPHRQRQLILAAIPCALAFYWFSGALAEGRGQGRLELAHWPEYVGHEMFRETLFILDEVPARRPYMYGETFVVELLNPIPRFLWEGKPLGFGIVYAHWYGEDPLQGGPTLSPGILGEMYVNFGVFGIAALSMFAGVLCRAWDRLGPQYTDSLPVLMCYAVGLGCFLMMGRSFSLRLFYPVIATLVCIALATRRERRLALRSDRSACRPASSI